MTDGIMLQISDDGKATLYESTYDITIHCESEKEQREVMEKLNSMNWIPVSERLPEGDHWLGGSGKQFSDNVLVSISNSDDEDEWVDVSKTIDGEWMLELPRYCRIVAWMPLPEPYREEK